MIRLVSLIGVLCFAACRHDKENYFARLRQYVYTSIVSELPRFSCKIKRLGVNRRTAEGRGLYKELTSHSFS